MIMTQSREVTQADEDKIEQQDTEKQQSGKAEPPKEVGGREGPDPTRYGDWEKGGRCIDF